MTRLDPKSGHSSADESVEKALGQVLRAGVILAVILTVVGAALLIHQNHGISGRALISQQTAPHSPWQIISLARHGDGASVILVGLLVLLATPVFRVASMVFAFLWEKDWLYAAISAGVLGVLIFGIFFAS